MLIVLSQSEPGLELEINMPQSWTYERHTRPKENWVNVGRKIQIQKVSFLESAMCEAGNFLLFDPFS